MDVASYRISIGEALERAGHRRENTQSFLDQYEAAVAQKLAEKIQVELAKVSGAHSSWYVGMEDAADLIDPRVKP